MSRAQPLIVQLYGNFNVDPRTTVDDLFHKLCADLDERFSSCIFLFVFVRNLCEYLSYTIFSRAYKQIRIIYSGIAY